MDLEAIADAVSSRLGLELSTEHVIQYGSMLRLIRPAELVRPNGFYFALAPSPRAFSAEFGFDRYAAHLLASMELSDDEVRGSFASAVSDAQSGGLRVAMCIDDVNVISTSDLPVSPWREFEFRIDMPLRKVRSEFSNGDSAWVQLLLHAFAVLLPFLPLEDVDDLSVHADGSEGLPEGAVSVVEVNRYERSARNRAAAIAHHGSDCLACGIGLGGVYGPLGSGFIHVHHVTPVSELGAGYVIDPARDLVPLCPNCHAMVHRQNPPLRVDELRRLIQSQSD